MSQEHINILCIGLVCLDNIALFEQYPSTPDKKYRTTGTPSSQVGGNCANVIHHLNRINTIEKGATKNSNINLNSYLVSKIYNDVTGFEILEKLKKSGINIEGMCVKRLREDGKIDGYVEDFAKGLELCLNLDGNGLEDGTAFTYVVVGCKEQSRTCLHTPLKYPLCKEDAKYLLKRSLFEGMKNKVGVVYLDGRNIEGSLFMTKEICENSNMKPFVVLECERLRKGEEAQLLEAVQIADCMLCSANFPDEYLEYIDEDESNDKLEVFVSMIYSKNPRLMHISVTFGKNGSMIVLRNSKTKDVESIETEEIREWMLKKRNGNLKGNSNVSQITDYVDTLHNIPVHLCAKKIKGQWFTFLYCESIEIKPGEDFVIDTNGAGDAYNFGMILSNVLRNNTSENIISFLKTQMRFSTLCAWLSCNGKGTSFIDSVDIVSIVENTFK